MGAEENKQVVERLWELAEKQDWDGAGALLHDDFVQEWPQSGERIRGRDNCMAVNKNYPGFPKMTMRRALSDGDLVTTVDLDDPDEVGDLVVDRVAELVAEEHIPVHVIPVRTPERIKAALAQQASSRRPRPSISAILPTL